MFGFTYKSANKRSTAVISAAQAVLTQVQNIGCQEVIPKMIYNIKNSPKDNSVQSPSDMKSRLSKEVTNMVKFIQASDASKKTLENSLVKLANTVVDNSIVSGKVDQNLVKQNMVDLLSSFCPGKMMGKFDGPPKPITDDQLTQIQKIFETFESSLSESEKKTINDVFSKIPNSSNNHTTATFDDMTRQVINASGALKSDLKLKVIAAINNSRAVVKLPPLSISMYTKSTFGSMSHFGSGSCLFLLFLLIVVGVLYYLHSQGKIKFPTMGQRISQFGRDIRSIRGIRVRR
jgi:hypothetical protein